MNYFIQGETDIGITKEVNQDSYYAQVCDCEIGSVVYGIVCDGLGGYESGELASSYAVVQYKKWADEFIRQISSEYIPNETMIEHVLQEVLFKINTKIVEYGKKQGIRLGTTLTAILIINQKYYIVHIGDTRVYEIKDDIKLLTKDQTLVEREIDQGILTYEEAKVDERRSILLQCIGVSDKIYPQFITGDVMENTVYLLCTDGFRHNIDEKEIISTIRRHNFKDARGVKQTIHTLIELNKQRQETDNITALIIATI